MNCKSLLSLSAALASICTISSANALTFNLTQSLNLSDYCGSQVIVQGEQVEPFKLGNKHFLAVLVTDAIGSCKGVANGAMGVHVYEWGKPQGSTTEQFIHTQHINAKTPGTPVNFNPTSIEIVDNELLLIAHNDDPNNTGDTDIDLWWFDDDCNNGTSASGSFCDTGERVLYSNFNFVKDMEFVRTKTEDYLVVSSYGNRQGTQHYNFRKNITIHPWLDNTFGNDTSGGAAYTMGGRGITSFVTNNQYYIIAASQNNESGYIINNNGFGNIAKNKFDMVFIIQNDHKLGNPSVGGSSVPTYGNYKWEAFTVNGASLLIPANGYSDPWTGSTYNIMQWNGSTLAPMSNSAPVNILPGQKQWKSFQIGSQLYFLAALPFSNSNMVYAWSTNANGNNQVGLSNLNVTVPMGPLSAISTHNWEHMKIKHADNKEHDYVFRVDDNIDGKDGTVSTNGGIVVQVYQVTG